MDGSIWKRQDYDDSFDFIADSSVTYVMTGHLVSGITAGMKYDWRVGYVDSGSRIISTSKEYSFLVGEESSCLSPVREGNGVGDTVFDYRMISFPHWPRISSAEKLFGLTDDPTVFRAGTYVPGSGYKEYGQGLRIKPGRAYWVLSREPVNVSFSGVTVSTGLDIETGLFYNRKTGNGWNQIGVPNNKVYSWKDIQVVQYNPGSGATIFGPTPVYSGVTYSGVSAYIDTRLWKWTGDPDLPYISYDPNDSGATAQLHPYCGYWVKAKKPNVFLVFPADAGEPAGLSVGFYDVPRVSQADISRTVFMDSPPMPGSGSNRSSSETGCFIGTALYAVIPASMSVVSMALLGLAIYFRRHCRGRE
ncbi:MAG: hypothetical protein JRJ23_10825 [Deltaproteobacteria bacterium]|nr:hypothetical protein [Deltaproteobacteria bacterium]